MTLKESATAFVFDYEEATAGERAVCLSTDGEYFVELGKVTAVTLEGLSVDRWVTGLPIAASLVGEIAVSGSFVEGSSLKFVRASCDEAVPEVPIVDGKLDVEVPFAESGVFKTCLVSPGASHAYLFSAVEVTVSELEVSTTPAVVNQLINTKHVVELSVHLSAENMTTVVVFVSADDCATELVEAVEITESATVQFAFATGFDSALTVCSRFASEAAKATGTTLNLYSVFFDPSVWTPFFDIPFQVTGVSIKTPFDQDVLVNWIPLEESCENVNEGENLKGLKSTVFRKNGVLKACVSLYGNPYETIPTSQHLVSMYDRIDLTTTPARVIANSRFIAHIESGTRHLIETIGWKHESGEESEQLSLFDVSAPFTLALAGR